MAGAGYKLFSTGDVLSASDVNTYLMQQTVMSFANAAARTSALSGILAEGLVSYLQDTNVVEIYTGAAWVSLDDPNAIQNTLLTTTGDMIAATSANTPARLAAGSSGQVLTANGAGVLPSWQTPAGGGGKILQVVSATTTTSTTINSATFTDTALSASITPSTTSSRILVMTTQGWATTRSDSGMEIAFRLLRGATVVYAPHETTNVMTWGISYTGVTTIGAWNGVMNMSYVDSPASTSAQTYKTQGMNRTTSNSATFVVQRNSFPASIVLMEIGA